MGSQYLITTKITLFQVNLQLNSLIGRYKETQLEGLCRFLNSVKAFSLLKTLGKDTILMSLLFV